MSGQAALACEPAGCTPFLRDSERVTNGIEAKARCLPKARGDTVCHVPAWSQHPHRFLDPARPIFEVFQYAAGEYKVKRLVVEGERFCYCICKAICPPGCVLWINREDMGEALAQKTCREPVATAKIEDCRVPP
jgi:hypothetical protein